MTISSIISLITKDYGLKDDDMDKIIRREKLKDVSQAYSDAISNIQNKFGSITRLRVLEYNELSGSNRDSKIFFRDLALQSRNVFYNHLFSNKECCVIFVYSGYQMKNSTLFKLRILPHEFAHHFQMTDEEFPCLLPRGVSHDFFPQFASTLELGPRNGLIYIDNLSLEDCLEDFFKDFAERIQDRICSEILKRKGFLKGLLDEYLLTKNDETAKSILRTYPNYEATIRYLSRLALLDEAEWHASIKSVGGSNQISDKLKLNLRRIMKLNKDFSNRKEAFRELYDLALKMDYKLFREKRFCTSYIKQVSNLLNFEVRTEERW